MTQPLALLLYENLLPGSQLANRLQDAGWRVQTLHDGSALARTAEELKPMLVLTDLVSSHAPVTDGIKSRTKPPLRATSCWKRPSGVKSRAFGKSWA